MKHRRREERKNRELWELLRQEVGEERLAELYCYGAVRRIRAVLHTDEEAEQRCREIAAILRDIGLEE